MTKRSPILGYNHNVRYRGLVFHVQTEDSGVLSPHLFTHLFHEGVIVSTRKLVYDAGSAEDAIKALMQAQHKAVMKDLKHGAFDEKIDQYLGTTPGLEPRTPGTGAVPAPRASAPELTPTIKQERVSTEDSSAVVVARAKSDDALTTPVDLAFEVSSDPNDLSTPIELPRKAEPEPVPLVKPRTKTADRGSKPGAVRFTQPPMAPPPPSNDLDPPTLNDDMESMAAAVRSANTTATPATPPPVISRTVTPGPTVTFRSAAPPPIPRRASTPPPIPTRGAGPRALDSSSAEISVSHDDESSPGRVSRDTAVESPADALHEDSDGVPRRGGDSAAPRTRPASHGASTLPPATKPSRPAITPPSVMSRPISGADDKSGAVEIYAPAPASADAPPGERAERPGQYSVSRQRAADVPLREKTGRVAALASPPPPAAGARPRSPSANERGPGAGRPVVPTPLAGSPVPQTIGRDPSTGDPRAARSPQVTAPIASRPNPQPGSGVVMTRPAVIVGAPPKTAAQPAQARVRKAREDEGRGFGQGLISEKSLDEVILAYLSEDGDDK